jgi:hypothetical protein
VESHVSENAKRGPPAADKEKRKELMIIYGEGLAPTGFTASELSEGGKARDRWPGIADGLLERAQRGINIEFAKR